MIFTNRVPESPLNNYVECLFHFKEYQPEHSVEQLVPDGCINITIALDDQPRYLLNNESRLPVAKLDKAWLSGIHEEYISLGTPRKSDLLIIRFKPGGSFPFLKFPLEEINNRVIAAESVIGQKILDFREKIMQIEEPENKLAFSEKWIEQHFHFHEAADDVIAKTVAGITSDPSFMHDHLQQTLSSLGYSQARFLHLFKKHVGPAPLLFQRISRFREALHTIHLMKHVNWVHLSVDCGYADESDCISDFMRFSGLKTEVFPGKLFETKHFSQVN